MEVMIAMGLQVAPCSFLMLSSSQNKKELTLIRVCFVVIPKERLSKF
jgi:hypothetical protein